MLVVPDAKSTVLQCLPRNGVGMEIGVWRGDFSANILRIAEPRKLYLVDPWKATSSATHRKSWYSREKVTQERMDQLFEHVKSRFSSDIAAQRVMVHRAPSHEVLPTLTAGAFDFVYIDGDHTFEGVSKDLSGAFRIVRVGGLVCGDDYSQSGWWGDGVVRGLHQFIATHPVIIEFAMNTQFVIRKLKDIN